VCPSGVSHDVLTSQKQELVGEIGFLPLSNANPSRTSNLRIFLTNGLHVPYDLNVDVEVVQYTAVTNGLGPGTFRYKRDLDQIWSPPIAFDLRAAQTNTMNLPETAAQLVAPIKGVKRGTGVYAYFDATGISATTYMVAGDRFYFNITANGGRDYRGTDDNTAHSVQECSGRGTCSSGACACVPGFGGPACERTTCPNDCSGHGMCQPLQRFAAMVAESSPNAARSLQTGATVDVKYSLAFDAKKQYSCFCEIGFRGVDCADVACPSGPDPMGGLGGAEGRECSGRGSCDTSTGTCQCAQGYFGARCEARSTFV